MKNNRNQAPEYVGDFWLNTIFNIQNYEWCLQYVYQYSIFKRKMVDYKGTIRTKTLSLKLEVYQEFPQQVQGQYLT